MWAAAWMKRLEVMRKMDGIRIDSESCGVGVGAILDEKDGVNPMACCREDERNDANTVRW